MEERDKYKSKILETRNQIEKVDELVAWKVSEALKNERAEHDWILKDFNDCWQRLESLSVAKRNDEDMIIDLNHKIEKMRGDLQFYSQNSSYQALMTKID